LIVAKLKPVTAHLTLPHHRSPLRHLLNTFSKSNYHIGFLATAFLSIGGFLMMPFSSAFAVNNLKVTHEQLPLLFVVS
jgi:predicted MFS family arabinose efflux permease